MRIDKDVYNWLKKIMVAVPEEYRVAQIINKEHAAYIYTVTPYLFFIVKGDAICSEYNGKFIDFASINGARKAGLTFDIETLDKVKNGSVFNFENIENDLLSGLNDALKMCKPATVHGINGKAYCAITQGKEEDWVAFDYKFHNNPFVLLLHRDGDAMAVLSPIYFGDEERKKELFEYLNNSFTDFTKR